MTTAVPYLSGGRIPDRCVATATSGRQTIRTAHYYQNANKGFGKPLWVCANCKQEKP